ncbi:MAG: D-alanine--D-alanine ligase [Rhodospirillaceae bacterium]|nr:D-alanine--D-alanine ligase [Rhodospirillaceae bacterium]MBT5660290.1 D-alanine--D-alanine ligase [Rhodospirillaceae bacterium]
MTKHVAVVMGGWSAEREVSLISGANIAESLRDSGYRVTAIDAAHDVGALLPKLKPKPDVVFNALHGRYGEDGCFQGLLELESIPYTHSGVLASALAMDKPMAKRLFETAGLPCAPGKIAHRDELLAGDVMERPYVVKPLNEGSSVGVRIITDKDEEKPFEHASWPYGEQVLTEAYIRGRELTVAVMGDRALGVLEISAEEGFYDYEAKYSDDFPAEHLMPAPIPEEDAAEAMRMALLAHQTLGCRGVSRADFRYDDTGKGKPKLYLLEINTQPGMTPNSLLPEIAAHAGVSFDELVKWMVENAQCDS